MNTVSQQKDPVEGMVFLTFRMRDDSVSEKTIELVGKTIVHQKLKSEPSKPAAPNHILIRQLSSTDGVLSTHTLDHPLLKRFEFADDEGRFQTKSIKLKDAEFFARVTLYQETVYIQVEEELEGKITYTRKFKIRE